MNFRGIVLHTIGVRGETTVAAVRKYHVEHNGWKDIGYHFMVHKDGTVEAGRPLTSLGAHTQGANDTIGIVVNGDGDHEPWTLEQCNEVLWFCADLCRAHGWTAENVHGHREAPARLPGAVPVSKTCPGVLVDMDAVRTSVAAVLAGVGGRP